MKKTDKGILFISICFAIVLLSQAVLPTLSGHSEILFCFLLIAFCLTIVTHRSTHEIWTHVKWPLLSITLSSIVVELIYVPMLYLNPKINWARYENTSEVDPYLILMFVPPINILGSIVLAILFSAGCLTFRRLTNASPTNID